MFARAALRNAPHGSRAASAIALKYSNALYSASLAKSPQTLSKVHAELSNLTAALKQDAQLNSLITNPTLSSKDRAAGLSQLYSKIEKKDPLSDVTKNLLALLSENGRLAETQSVVEGFNELFAQYKGELNVIVTSAAPLPKDILTKLETTLKQSQAAQQSKTLKVTNKVNPSVLGGLVVDFGDKTIDLSVQSRVTKLNNVLQQSV
jgi:F-type H+-transporting ATPase subunit O